MHDVYQFVKGEPTVCHNAMHHREQPCRSTVPNVGTYGQAPNGNNTIGFSLLYDWQTTPPPAAPPFWIDHPFPPSAPYPPTVPNYPSDYTAGATITVTVDFSVSCADIDASTLATKLGAKIGPPPDKVKIACAGKDTSRRRRRQGGLPRATRHILQLLLRA